MKVKKLVSVLPFTQGGKIIFFRHEFEDIPTNSIYAFFHDHIEFENYNIYAINATNDGLIVEISKY